MVQAEEVCGKGRTGQGARALPQQLGHSTQAQRQLGRRRAHTRHLSAPVLPARHERVPQAAPLREQRQPEQAQLAQAERAAQGVPGQQRSATVRMPPAHPPVARHLGHIHNRCESDHRHRHHATPSRHHYYYHY